MNAQIENQAWNESLEEDARAQLHVLMENRLEEILTSMAKSRKKGRTLGKELMPPANNEKPDWNIGEIPILFGA